MLFAYNHHLDSLIYIGGSFDFIGIVTFYIKLNDCVILGRDCTWFDIKISSRISRDFDSFARFRRTEWFGLVF